MEEQQAAGEGECGKKGAEIIAAFRDTWGGEVIPFTPHSGKEGPKRLKFTRRDTSLKNQHLSS